MNHKNHNSRNNSSQRNLLICLVLVIATLTVYFQVRTFGFINYDTPEYLLDNNYVKKGLSIEGLKWSFTTIFMSNYHPVTWISHMMDVEIYGLNPGYHHNTNLLIHVFNTLLIFLLLSQLTGKSLRSAFVAGLFALHPLHIQSVIWVAERKDLLSTFFMLLSIWSYRYYVQRQNLWRYFLVVIFFLLGLLSKPMIVTLPFVLLLFDYWPLGRFKKKEQLYSIFLDKIPLLLLSVVSGAMTIYTQKAGGAMASLADISYVTRINNALVSYAVYIYKTFSINLCFFITI